MAKLWYRLIWSAAAVEFVAAAALPAYLGLRARSAAGREACATQTVTAREDQPDDPIVCTMRGNRYYHRRTCRYVRPAKIAMPLSRAQLHCRPCSRCKPPR